MEEEALDEVDREIERLQASQHLLQDDHVLLASAAAKDDVIEAHCDAFDAAEDGVGQELGERGRGVAEPHGQDPERELSESRVDGQALLAVSGDRECAARRDDVEA